MKLIYLALGAIAKIAYVKAHAMTTCLRQSDCISLSITELESSCDGSCAYRICVELVLDDGSPENNCVKDAVDTVSHTCVKNSTTCPLQSGFSFAEEITRIVDGFLQCQTVKGGAVAEFLLKDGVGCGTDSGAFTISDIPASCEPRTASTDSCTGNEVGKECIWKIQAPECSPPKPPSQSPTSELRVEPTLAPTAVPTSTLTVEPTVQPTFEPTAPPTADPTSTPTFEPTAPPTADPISNPTGMSIPPSDNTEDCVDDDGWVDSFGDGCDYYETFLDECLFADQYENDGKTALDACCVCKGVGPTPAPVTLSPTPAKPTSFDEPSDKPTSTVLSSDKPTAKAVASDAPSRDDGPEKPFCKFFDLDFDDKHLDLDSGDFVSNQLTRKYFVLVNASSGTGYTPNNAARLLDSSNPPKHDLDLGSPNEACPFGGPGVGEGGRPDSPYPNCIPLNNVLIIQDENVLPAVGANKKGGNITLSFTRPAEVRSIGILDIDEGWRKTPTIIVTKLSGSEISFSTPTTGNNSFYRARIKQDGVIQLKIVVPGSGAISDLRYKVCANGTSDFDENGDIDHGVDDDIIAEDDDEEMN